MSKCLTRDCDHDAPHGELLCHPCGYGYTPSFINAMRSQYSEPQYKFQTGDLVTKRKGSSWTGRIVGHYSTTLTPEGYAVESLTEKGSVQIYPAAALDLYEQDFAASAAETSTAVANGQPDYSDALHRGGSVDKATAGDDLISQRQAAEYMAEVLATVKRKTKRMAQQVPQRFHGELFDLAITAARAVAKWEFVNQPNANNAGSEPAPQS